MTKDLLFYFRVGLCCLSMDSMQRIFSFTREFSETKLILLNLKIQYLLCDTLTEDLPIERISRKSLMLNFSFQSFWNLMSIGNL